MDCRGHITRGFTLIELLVVISIISLLMGVLVPSLGKARDTAQSVACMAHLRAAGQAMASYATQWSGHLAGPNTSGLQQTILHTAHIYSDNPAEPVQNSDWISPTLGWSLGLPPDRDQRIVAIFNHRFRCPANREKYMLQFGVGGPAVDPTTLFVVSYSAIISFHVYENNPGDGSLYARSWLAVDLPTQRTSFTINGIGTPSEKIYAMDGARYVNYNTDQVSYNAFPKQIDGGNYMNYGAAISINLFNGDPYARSADGSMHPLSRRYAYRHSGSINAVFFDGHTETLTEPESRRVDMYFPAGSIVNTAALTDDPDDYDGYVIR